MDRDEEATMNVIMKQYNFVSYIEEDICNCPLCMRYNFSRKIWLNTIDIIFLPNFSFPPRQTRCFSFSFFISVSISINNKIKDFWTLVYYLSNKCGSLWRKVHMFSFYLVKSSCGFQQPRFKISTSPDTIFIYPCSYRNIHWQLTS